MDFVTLYNKDAEKQVLGYMLNATSEVIRRLRDELDPECFYSDFHRSVYETICKLDDSGLNADIISVTDHFRKLGQEDKLFDIVQISSSYTYYDDIAVEQHIQILNNYRAHRKLWMLGQLLITEAKAMTDDKEHIDEIIANAQEELLHVNLSSNEDDVSLREILSDLSQRIDNNTNGIENADVTKTGFPYIDANGGFEAGTLIIIGAVASMGKTSLADSFVLSIIKQDIPVAFFSLEMTNIRIAARMLSSVSTVNSQKLYNDKLDYMEKISTDKAFKEMDAYADNLFFPRKPKTTLAGIIKAIRYFYTKRHIRGAVIDYVQLISGESSKQNREQFIGECAHTLQALAKELGIWIVLLSQLNRSTNSGNPVPSGDSLRDSGQIKEAADCIYLIYRPQYYNDVEGKDYTYPVPYEHVDPNGTAMIIAAKNRNGTTGSFICGFNPMLTTFYPLCSMPEQQEEPKKEEKQQDPTMFGDCPF